ncbi:hemagglutinin repeat-containing protein [Serratia marcescens]|uniref:hemagglutinin repeat-containing protein n=1 Tax=Serratia marcescens TaxID=615 RepID=UPI0006586AD4|nr:hemagglutinin repeat-containing protein [Serratia marcescens]AWC72866.1 filamentous hemagglutinin N-terminal domain-containing protein [Serratia marcescens]AWC90842.1 filamentous hemagglutinin N-terminal domain-containing protein [Serratia marcescens]AWS56953.1 filamentous hemagglutinin N-terminal domain-containing protein [Serratia marcescens]AWS68327.1 filamentous hemagglutinin N-terminal domain-containing protein [Serratia marcescens]ELX7486162.1 hemagglutinin repeat-containing protein [
MNKHCYRLIFSRTHGELRVVSELARSCSSEPGQRIGSGITDGSRLWVTVRRSVWLLGLLMFAGPVMADGIVADGGANPSQRPEVITTQNGLPQVNITAPNQAGVSHNQYQQFDVDAKGAILNNSAVMTATQMAGMIQGNPNLNPNSAPARVILNEVNSNNPSQLRGFMEVAGGKAQVIVANPAGIVCNGCGTINAGRMTLTTGKPQLNADGSVAGYQVERGVVRIEGGGLNGDTRHDTEYVDILARAVEVNAGVWAKEGVTLVAGRNRVSADGKTAAPLSDDGSARPELAIDMGQMGGMYSGGIRMIGTEAGVGVRNQGGQVRAGKTLTVSSEGKLSWRSDAPDAATQAGGDIQLAAKGDIETHGKVYSGGQLAVQSREGMLTQSGTLAAAGNVHLNAARGIQSSGHLLAGSNAESTLVHDANLQLDSQGDIRASGSLLGKKNVNASGRRVDISGAQVAAGRTALAAREGGVALRQSTVDSGELAVSTKGNVDAQQARVKAGRWAIDADSLFNQQATWSQTGDGESRFTLAGALDNSDGTIETQSLRLSAGQLVNQRGRLVALGETAQHWRVGGLLDNGGGTMGSNGDLRLDAGRLDNQRGTIKTQAGFTLHADGAVNNAGGNLLAGNGLTLEAGSDLNNQSGTLSGDDVRLAVQRLDNAQGQVIGQGNLEMTAGRLDNQRGLMGAGKALNVHAGDWDNRGGTAQGETAVTATASNLNNDGGKLLSGHTSTLKTSGNATNRGGEISATVLTVQSDRLDNTQGKVIGRQRLNLHARQGLDNTQGLLGAGEMLTVSSEGELSNHHGRVQGNGQTTVSARDIRNEAGKLLGGQRLSLTASGVLGNREGEISGESLTLTAQRLDNAQGKVVARQDANLTAKQGLSNAAGWLEGGSALAVNTDGDWDNQGGTAQGGRQVTANAQSLDNTGGRLQSGGGLTLDAAGNILNRSGKLTAQQALAVNGGASSLFDNDGGSLQSGGDLSLQGGQLTNRAAGVVLGGQALSLNLAGGWDNQNGTLTGNGRTQVRAASLLNAQGAINALDSLDMQFTGKLDNRQGRVFSQSSQVLQAQDIVNTQGWMGSLGSWRAISGGFDNTQGSVQSRQETQLTADWLDNARGVMQSAQNLALRIKQDIDNRSGKVSAQGQLTVQGAADGEHAGAINNTGGEWLAGQALTIAARSLDNVQAGQLYSQKQLRLNLNGGLDNRGGKIQGGDALALDAQALNNAGGTIDGQQRVALRILGLLENTGGAVRSNGGQEVSAAGINNTRGVFSSRGGITVASKQLDNTGGTLISQGAGTYRLDRLNNQHGKVHSGDALTLEGAQVNNRGGQLVSTHGLTFKAGTLDNSGQGTLSSQAELDVQAERLNNRDGGLILGTTRTDITSRDIDNTAGRLQSSGQMTLSGVTQLDNRQGRILANGNLNINTDRSRTDSPLALLNQGGRVESAGQLTLHARTLDNQNGTLLGLQALTLSAQQDYTHQAGETISSNGTVTFSLSGAFTNLADWLLPGKLALHAASITNPAALVGKTLQLTTGALQNTGRLEADSMALNVDTLDNAAALMGDDITVNGRIIDNHGAPAVMAATHSLTVQAGERLTNREGALIYSADRLHLHSDDLIENRASFIEADGDATVEVRRLNNLREGLVIERNAEKSDYKWHRYNYYWRSYGSKVNPDKITLAPTTQQLTYQDDAAAQTNRYGTLLTIDAAGKRTQVRVKDNKGQLTDLWVNYLALKPNADGSYAMTFYETRGGNQLATIPTPYQNGFHWEHDWTQVMTWDPEKHVDIDSAPFITDYNNFRERTESGTVTRDKLVSEGIGARILAGGNMVLRITGALLNDASVITANGNLTQDGGGSVDNRGYSVNERRQAAIVDHYDKDTHHWYPTFNRDETTALATVDGVITGNGTVTINGARITNTTVNQAQISQLDAALKAVDAERAELERNPLAFTVEGAARPDGDTTLAPGEQMTRPGATPSSPLGRPLLPSELALTQLQHLGNVATAIPNNGLFSQHTATGSPFLVVTDERFTRRDNFISSDYMLERVGYDPAQAHKRLGDGFYEQRLVREQVLALTGKPSVKGWDAMEQYQQLMNNGSKVAQDFHLVPGVALTPEQIAALQQDIVWLVSETVQTEGGPQTVWVPKVYLAQATLRLTGDGALIGGGDLQLSANSITNAGNLFAEKALTVDAGQFLHQGGDVRAGSIDVQADSLAMSTNLQDALRQATMSAGDIRLRGTDITLTGAKLDATDTLSLSARNDLTITAAKSSHTADLEVISGSMGNRTRGGTEAAGSRMAHVSGEWQQALGSQLNAGGNLSLNAGRDVTFTGSQASAAGSTRVQAGGDINIRAETTTNTTHLDANSRTSSVSNDRQEERLTVSALGGDQGVTLVAGNRLLAEGAQIDSKEGRIGVSARDVSIKDARTRTQDQDSENKREGKTKSHREEQTEREISTGSTFSGREGVTVIGREGDVTVTGSTLHSDQGAIALQAKNDVILNHTTDSEHRVSNEESRGRKTRGERAEEVLRENVVGSTLSGQGGVTVVAQDGSIIATASALHSEQGAIALQAKQDVTLNTATERESALSEERSQKKGFLKKSSSHSVAHDATTREKGSLLSGNSVSVSAGNDLTVTGSAIAADQDVNLQAGRNVDIGAATETDTHYRLEEKKKSGLLGSGGIGFTIGKQSSKHEIDEKGRTQSQSVSTVGSSQGSVNVTAGNQLHIGGADLVAAKDLALTGDSVTIDPGVDARTRKETYEQKQSGLSVALSGTVGGALNTAVSSAQQARKEGDGRLTALQNTKAALSGVQAAQAWERDNALTASAEAKNAAAGLQPGDEGATQGATNTVGISASYGSQSSKSETRTDSRQSQGSTLTAGQNLSITASGKNHNAQSGDIVVTGSQLKAGKDLSLDAARDITLQSAQNRESTVGKNSSKGGNVGVGIGAGSGGYGISVSAGVNAGKGHENGNGLTHAETTLDAGSNLKVTSGRDTRLTGAQASGEKVTVDVGRNLALESQQDSDRYDARQTQMSGGISVPIGAGSGSANFSASKDKLHSNFDSVKEQTGLFAGQGGYDVKVKEHTQLDGAVIASQADKEKNRLDTGTLGWTDIHNQADYSATHSGGSFSTGGPVGKDLLTNMAGGMLSGANHSGHAEGTTKAGVSEGTLIVRDTGKQQQDVAQLNRDTEHANAGSISPIFNKEKEQNRLKQAQLIGEIGGQAMDVIRTQGDIAGLKAQKDPAALSQAREQLEKSGKPTNDAAVMQRAYDNAMRQYGTGSDLQKAAQAVTGALTALAGNNLAGALASGASPYLATEIKKRVGEDNIAANAMAHAVLGAVTAQLNNQSAAAGGLGAGGGELAARYIAGQLYPGKTAQQLSESEKQQVSALSQLAAGLAGGLATGDTAGAVTGGQAGKNAVENNYLSVEEKTKLELAKQKLQNSKDPAEREQAQQTINELREKDIASDKKVIEACGNGAAASAACGAARLEVIAAKGEYETGPYNSKVSQQYADAYGQIVNLLNITSVDAQSQQQVKDAMVNYAMVQLGVDKATAEAYIETYDGMKIVAASLTPVLGSAAAKQLGKIVDANLKVVAKGNVDGSKFTDTNQGIRPSQLADFNKPTLINDVIQAKIDKRPDKNYPNGNMGTAHAEIGVIQQAFDKGMTQGREMAMSVAGKEVCNYCLSDVRTMAEKAGLKSLTIYEEATGNVLFWQQGMKKIENRGPAK